MIYFGSNLLQQNMTKHMQTTIYAFYEMKL